MMKTSTGDGDEDGQRDFNVFVGAETGLLKGLHLGAKGVVVKNFHSLKQLHKEEEITCMAWGNRGGGEVITGLRNNTVRLFDPSSKSFSQSLDCSTPSCGPLRGVAKVGGGAIVTAEENGLIKVWRQEEQISFNAIKAEVAQMGKRKKRKVDSMSEESRQSRLSALKCGRTLCRMRACDSDPSVVATGGKENDLQLWDLERASEGVPIFRAKNVAPDHLQLRVPVWVSDLCFPSASSSRLVATCNGGGGHVRLYDARTAQRRPAQQLHFQGETLTAIAPTPNQDQVNFVAYF